MASKMQRSDDFNEQFLTCPVCMLHFRDPRVLPCLHTFCKECLQEWATKQQPLECPTCSTQVSLPDQGVDGLRTNFYVNNLMDFAAAKKGAEPGVSRCQVCEGKEEGARSWCVQCAVLLCESYTNTHRRFPAMKGHQIVTKENPEASEGVPSSFQRKAFCPKHEDQVLTFYCEPCQTLVCVACTVVDHRSGDQHNPVEIGSVAERKKQDLQKLIAKIEPREKDMRTTMNDIEKEISELPTSADAAIEQTTVYFDQLMALLRDRQEKVVTEVGLRRQEVRNFLETQKDAIQFQLAGLMSASEFCKQALEHGSDMHVIEVEGQARQTVEELLTTPNDLTARPSQVVFSEGTAVAKFRDRVARAGRVHVRHAGKVDASKCLVRTKRVDESRDLDALKTEPLPLKRKKPSGDTPKPGSQSNLTVPTTVPPAISAQRSKWQCDICLSHNSKKATRCAACKIPNQGSHEPSPGKGRCKDGPQSTSTGKTVSNEEVQFGAFELASTRMTTNSKQQFPGPAATRPSGVFTFRATGSSSISASKKSSSSSSGATRSGGFSFGPTIGAGIKAPSQTKISTGLQTSRAGLKFSSNQLSAPTSGAPSRGLNFTTGASSGQSVAGSPSVGRDLCGDTPVLSIGRRGGGEGELSYPRDVAVDMDGNIAVLEAGNKRVQIFDSKTVLSLRCFPLEDYAPFGIDIDSSGQFVVTSENTIGTEKQAIRVYSQEGKLTKTLKSDCLRHPRGVAVLQNGRMVVADSKQKSCLLLQPDGSLIRDIGKGKLQYPRFLAADESRDLFFVTDSPAHRVLVFDLEGKLKFSFGEQGRNEGELSWPTGITVDPAGNIVVVNRDGGRLQVFGSDGTYLRTVATVKGGFPQGIELTPDGHIAVACSYGHCIKFYRYRAARHRQTKLSTGLQTSTSEFKFSAKHPAAPTAGASSRGLNFTTGASSGQSVAGSPSAGRGLRRDTPVLTIGRRGGGAGECEK
ncbi:tripartite motif-containing protein 2-like [Branchiostoma floridae]|uniref:RanBP-type and C3HC4-type zinc finger-containing protein 1 n=1 Tax=Branchiostoma floridae TaxID=7739 RepID=A0A9J7MBT3_BRAFL|nr:tripartite motif-containing protein 2-like [Branchiostoma floridae]